MDGGSGGDGHVGVVALLEAERRAVPGDRRRDGPTYVVSPADVGSVLRVRLRVTNSDGFDEARSPATALGGRSARADADADTHPDRRHQPRRRRRHRRRPRRRHRPRPRRQHQPRPRPRPRPRPSADVAVIDVLPAPTASIAAPALAPSPTTRRLPLLRPFPVVRIKGVMTPRGARVSLLSVSGPRGARVVVACSGRDCPVRRLATTTAVRRLRTFEREFRAGTRLEVTITKPGFIGKRTVIVIRRNAAPWRSDRCLTPGAARAERCPAA